MELLPALFGQMLRSALGNADLVFLFVAYYVMSRLVGSRASAHGLDGEKVAGLSIWVGVGAVVGGRLGYVLPTIRAYLAHPFDLLLVNGGMYFYGALLGALVVGLLATRRSGLPLLGTADVYGLYAPVAIAIVRFSCLLGNSCFGRQAPPPLGIMFPGLTQLRYPSELYEGLLVLMILGALLWLSQRDHPRGTLFLAFLASYPVARALTDLSRINFGSQVGLIDLWLSLAVSLVAAILLWTLMRPSSKRPDLDRPASELRAGAPGEVRRRLNQHDSNSQTGPRGT